MKASVAIQSLPQADNDQELVRMVDEVIDYIHGISSENIGENPMHRKPKVSHGRLVRVGLVGT